MTTRFRLAVGSENRAKRRAVTNAIPSDVLETVIPVDVHSGVPEQPIGHPETRQGATNRARNALTRVDAELGVGIEGGIWRFPGAEDAYVIMWASVTDGRTTTTASGPSIQVPDAIADRAFAGEALGAILREQYGADAARKGAAGVLTNGALDRTEALETAVSGAFGRYRAIRGV